MSKPKRKNLLDGTLIEVKGGLYRSAADSTSRDGPSAYPIRDGAKAFLGGRAPGAPDRRVAEVEYGDNRTVRIEVRKENFTVYE